MYILWFTSQRARRKAGGNECFNLFSVSSDPSVVKYFLLLLVLAKMSCSSGQEISRKENDAGGVYRDSVCYKAQTGFPLRSAAGLTKKQAGYPACSMVFLVCTARHVISRFWIDYGRSDPPGVPRRLSQITVLSSSFAAPPAAEPLTSDFATIESLIILL